MTWSAAKLLAVLFAIPALAAPTVVRGTYTTVDGRPANGMIVVEVTRSFTASDGSFVPAQRKVVNIKNGIASVSLQPNTGSTPESFYTVSTSIDNGPVENTIWIVPTSATPVTVASVVTAAPPAATVTIPLAQLRTTGAASGDVPTFNGTEYVPEAPAPGGVTTVNGQSGAVTVSPASIGAQAALGFTPENSANRNASGGYAPLDSGSKLPVANLPTAIDSANLADGTVSNAEFQRLDGVTSAIQTQIDAKAGKDSNAIWVEDSCPGGPYNSACISTAFGLATDNSTVIFNRQFTVATKVSVPAKNYITVKGVGGGGIKSAANLNDYQIEFASCYYCKFTGLTMDGSKTNQTAASRGIRLIDAEGYILNDNVFMNYHSEPIWVMYNSGSTHVNGKIFGNQVKNGDGSIMYGELTSGNLYGYLYLAHNAFQIDPGNAPNANAAGSLVNTKNIQVYWDNNVCRVDDRSGMFGAFGGAWTLDTYSNAGFAMNTEGCSGFPGGVLYGANGANTNNIIQSFTPPTWAWTREHTATAVCAGGAAGTPLVTLSPTSTPTIQCLGTDPHAYGGVRLNGTAQSIIHRFRIPRTNDLFASSPISLKVDYYPTGGAPTITGLTIDLFCQAETAVNSAAPTYFNLPSTLNGGTVADGKQVVLTAGITSANLVSAGCASASSTGSLLFVKIRKASGTSAVDFTITNIALEMKRLLQ